MGTQLLDIILALNSTKKKEKLDALEQLPSVLNQEKHIKTLHQNTISKDGKLNWDTIYIRVHNSVLSLIDEKCTKSRQLSDKIVQIFQNVIHLVVQKSLNQRILLIDCNLVVSSILSVFESNYRIKILGSTYLSIFCKYVMSERRNWGQLKLENWIGMKNLCKDHVKCPPPGTQCVTFLEILCDVLRHSSKTCLATRSFLDIFDFVKSVYSGHKELGTNFEICLLRLTNILCLQLAVEFRYTVCAFAEDVFDYVVNSHRKNNSDVNTLVYHFLMTTISVHNPNGVSCSDKSAYAYNLPKWKSQIKRTHALCQNEARETLKDSNSQGLEMEFLDLFVDVTHLVSICGLENSSEVSDDNVSFSEPGPTNKRKCSVDGSAQCSGRSTPARLKLLKIENNFENIVSNLQTSGGWFWLRFLELFVRKFPHDLKHKHHAIIQVLYQIFCDRKDAQNVKVALRCLSCVVEAELSWTEETGDCGSVNTVWDKISAELIRCLPLENSTEAHALLQALIRQSKIRDPRPLIGLYCSGTLRPTPENVKTLTVACQHCVLPEVVAKGPNLNRSHENVRSYLLSWLLADGDDDDEVARYPCRDFAKLLVALILKKFEEDTVTAAGQGDILITHTNINDFCKLITNTYGTIAFQNLTFGECPKRPETYDCVRVDGDLKRRLLDLLETRWKSLLKSLNSDNVNFDEQTRDLTGCFWFARLLCHILSDLETISASTSTENKCLTEKLELLLHSSTTKTLKLLKVRFFDLNPMFDIYRTEFHPTVQKMIREPNVININLLQYLFELFVRRSDGHFDPGSGLDPSTLKSNSEFSELIKSTKSIFHFDVLTGREKVFVASLELLCQYITVPGSSDSNLYQNTLALKLIDDLLNDECLRNCSNFHLQIVLRVVYGFTKFDGIPIPVLNGCLDLMSSIFNGRPRDPELVLTVLQVLKDLMRLVSVAGDADTRSKYLNVVTEFRDLTQLRKTCGVRVVCKYVECLAEMYKRDPEGTWTVLEVYPQRYRHCEDVIKFLNHVHHEVRLTAALHVGRLFAADSTEPGNAWQKTMLKNLRDALSDDSGSVNSNNGVYGREEGSVARGYDLQVLSSVSLIAWAHVICLSRFCRKKAVFHLIHLAYRKQFKRDDVLDIVKLICKNLAIDNHETYFKYNFLYLISRWIKKGHSVEDFPYYLLGYGTVNDFVQNHFQSLVVVFSQSGQFHQLKSICSILKKPMAQLLKDCCPILMSFILPNLSENVQTETSQRAIVLKQFLDDHLPGKLSLHSLATHLDKVIYHMIANMHDPPYLRKLCDFPGNAKDDKSLLSCTGKQIVEALENLSTKEGKSLLGKMAADMPAMVERVLLRLAENVEMASVYEDKVLAFYKYVFFVDIIGRVTNKDQQFRAINSFIIRDVVHTLLPVTRSDTGLALTQMACECLKSLADSYLTDFGSVFGEFLPVVASILTPLAVKSDDPGKPLDVLRFLICENYGRLETSIAVLDPFPTHESFRDINQQLERRQSRGTSLKSVVEHFIRAGNSKSSGCRIEGLKHLRRSLSERKDELKDMYEDLSSVRGFSEDCRNSLLHQLICMLIELTGTGQSVAVRMESAKCLGELGPSDLTTLVLRPENNFSTLKQSESSLYPLLKTSLVVLPDLLVSDRFPVKKAASAALYAVLSVRQGRDILRSQGTDLKNVDSLLPFVSTAANDDLRLKIKRDVLVQKMSDPDLWTPRNHREWIVNLVDGLLQSLHDSKGIINSFRDLIRVHWVFAEDLLVLLSDIILSSNEKDCTRIINSNFQTFFESNFRFKRRTQTTVDKRSVQCMINVVDYVRIQQNQGICGEFCLDVSYLSLANAALYCSAFFTSILYAELWFEQRKKADESCVDLNAICESYPEEGFLLTDILRECHSKIGNSDGIHGCGYTHLLDETRAEIQHYEHVKNWKLSLLHHDIQLSMGNKAFESGLITSLDRSGMHYVLNSLVKGNVGPLEDVTSVQYKCAAQLSDWTLLDLSYKVVADVASDSFEKCFYFALKAFQMEDDATFRNEIQKGRKSVLGKLSNFSLESCENLYRPMSELQTLKELEEFALTLRNNSKFDLWNLYGKWRKQDAIRCGDFDLVESLLTNRVTFMRAAADKLEKSVVHADLHLMMCQTYCSLIAAGRRERKYETAIRMLSSVSNLGPRVPREISERLKIEKARLFWETGETQVGRFMLSHFIKKSQVTGEMAAEGLRIYGDWMATTKSENSREVIENYYMKSIGQSTDSGHLIESFASLAKFADGNYEQLNEYLSSPLFEIKQSLISTQQGLASELRQELGWNRENREKRMAYHIAARQSVIDENEIKNNIAERDSYLCLALKYYLMCLKEGEKYNRLVFRVVSMWLSNANNQEVVRQLKGVLHHIPTYKFLCLLPQLLPRLADVCLISDLAERILRDHPHHTLPHLFALSNSYEDLKYTGGGKVGFTTPRVQAAKSILEKFQKDPKLEKFITEMGRFSGALIEVANHSPTEKVSGSSGSPIHFPSHLQIRKIRHLTRVPVPSLHIPHNKACVYDDIVGVDRFDETYHLVGGINLPKRIRCVGSDGTGRSLLVKGRDDLRQDAVMQQVFTIMNSLLSENKETKKRKLVIRTYRVVPLSQRSGVIEWCENTQPMSLYLTGQDGKSGAHKRFNTTDISASDCRAMIRNVFAEPDATNADKLRVFLDICQKFHPVFHNFFLEKFPAAGVWFERRLAYIHSVATSSMIGYVLGIGDRHVNNILIDNSTAEVIHIDLGIAFEQGKTLPIPETVPFRLTRDIVDGMGLSGIEGDFRISCIKTMEVLRENRDAILTLLEVLLYDPLYTWTITPEKAYSMQGHAETCSTSTDKSSPDMETNKMAERALIRLKQKLQGTEVGCVAMNVEGQVSYLVQQAKDPNNLCRLFHGWQAYL